MRQGLGKEQRAVRTWEWPMALCTGWWESSPWHGPALVRNIWSSGSQIATLSQCRTLADKGLIPSPDKCLIASPCPALQQKCVLRSLSFQQLLWSLKGFPGSLDTHWKTGSCHLSHSSKVPGKEGIATSAVGLAGWVDPMDLVSSSSLP